MMKKLLVLMLVFGMASMANAALQIRANGVMEPADSETAVTPSETVTLGIWTDADITAGVGEWNGWALAARVADGSIVPPYGGGIILPPYDTEPGISLFDDAVGLGGIPLPPGENGVFGTILLTGIINLIPAGDVIYDEIVFHCEWAVNDVVVTLYGTQDYATLIPQDSIVIHNVPEPATIALLGFGGLLLRRRKK